MADLDNNLLAQIRCVLAKKDAASGDAPPSADPDNGGEPDDGDDDNGHGSNGIEEERKASEVHEDESPAQEDEPEPEDIGQELVEAYQEFLVKWKPRTEGLEHPLRLVVNQMENDFSGALVADDDYFVQDYLEDLIALFVKAGKIKGEDSLSRAHLEPFAMACTEKLKVSKNERNVIPTGKLIALDMLDQYPSEQLSAQTVNVFMRTLGTLADDRYLLLIGNEAEVWNLIHKYPVLEPTIGEHVIHLKSMNAA